MRRAGWIHQEYAWGHVQSQVPAQICKSQHKPYGCTDGGEVAHFSRTAASLSCCHGCAAGMATWASDDMPLTAPPGVRQ